MVNEAKNGIMVVEKWSDDSEYSPPPQTELVACTHARSEKEREHGEGFFQIHSL
jgi:hypothetical protein